MKINIIKLFPLCLGVFVVKTDVLRMTREWVGRYKKYAESVMKFGLKLIFE